MHLGNKIAYYLDVLSISFRLLGCIGCFGPFNLWRIVMEMIKDCTYNPFDLFLNGKTCFSTLSYRVSNCLIKENFGTNQYEITAEIHPIKAPTATSKG